MATKKTEASTDEFKPVVLKKGDETRVADNAKTAVQLQWDGYVVDEGAKAPAASSNTNTDTK